MTETALQLDTKAWALLMALQEDGRSPLKTLALAAGLSVPATVERLKRLKDAGVVRSVGAELDPALAGYPVRAIVGITVQQPGKKAFLDKLRRAPEVLECHHVAGADSYVMTVVARSLADLQRRGPVSVGDLLADAPDSRRDRIERGLVWLAKLGLLQIRSPRS